MKIQSNILAASIRDQLALTTRAIRQSVEKLSANSRLVHPGDDSVSFTLATKLDSKTRALTQVSQNINQSLGLLDSASAAIQTQLEIANQMRELAHQAMDSELSATERSSLQKQLADLLSEYNRIVNTTEYNGIKLLDGSKSSLKVQLGISESIDLGIHDIRFDQIFKDREIALLGNGRFSPLQHTEAPTFNYDTILRSDWNNDGTNDPAVLDKETGTIQIFTTGSGVSMDFRMNLGINWDQYELGDFDASGRPDVLTYNSGGSLQVISNGDSANKVSLSVEENGTVSLGDFSGDGQTDFAITNDDGIFIYLADGFGSFNLEDTILGSGLSVVGFEDLNGNSSEELVVLDQTNGEIRTYQESAGAAVLIDAEAFSASNAHAVIADLNNDAVKDVLVYDTEAGYFQTQLNNGSALLTESAVLSTYEGLEFSGLHNFAGSTPNIFLKDDSMGRYVTLNNDGAGNFSLVGDLDLGPGDWQASIMDIWGGGSANNLVIRNNTTGDVEFYWADSMGYVSNFSTDSNMEWISNIHNWSDTRSRMVLRNSSTGEMSVYNDGGGLEANFVVDPDYNIIATLNFASMTFEDGLFFVDPSAASWQFYDGFGNLQYGPITMQTPQNAKTDDLNGDGRSDIWSYEENSGVVSVWLTRGDGILGSVKTFLSVPNAAVYHYAADINGDGKKEIIISDLIDPNRSYHIFELNGAGAYTFAQSVAMETWASSPMGAYDVNGDGRADLVNWGYDGVLYNMNVRLAQANGTFASSQTSQFQFELPLGFKDFNNDGKQDFYTTAGANFRVFISNGNGTFTGAATQSFAYSTTLFGDMNGDGILDTVSAGGAAGVVVRLGAGDGTFGSTATYSIGNVSGVYYLADFNQDGRNDLIGFRSGLRFIALNNGTGGFTSGQTLATEMQNLQNAKDLNGDGIPDILASSGLNALFFINDGTGRFTLRATIPYGNSIEYYDYNTSADFNGDGIPDAVYYDAVSSNLSWANIQFSSPGVIARPREAPSVLDLDSAKAVARTSDYAIDQLTQKLALIAANRSRLEFASSHTLLQRDTAINVLESIRTPDTALEIASLVKNQILAQAQVAALAQANIPYQIVMNLLR